MANPCSSLSNRKLRLNVGGEKFEISSSNIFNRLPNSRLGKLYEWTSSSESILSAELWDSYCSKKDEYFFKRNSKSFSAVLSFYYTGKLHMPDGICVVAFTEDLEYWGIDESSLDSCCRYKYFNLMEQVKEEIKELQDLSCQLRDNERLTVGGCGKCQEVIWNTFENPASSWIAKVVAVISLTTVVVSTVVLALNTMPELQMIECVFENECSTVDNYYFVLAEEICIIWFTFEYVIRLLVSPNKCEFLKDLFNLFDLLAILPYIVTLIFVESDSIGSDLKTMIQICRLLRILRILKLARYSSGFQSLLFSLEESYRELGILFLFLIMGVFLFSSLAYYAERDVNPDFESIPKAFWWSAVTMNTVGLGDMQPATLLGKVVSFFCGVCGMLFVGLPIPIIVDTFTTVYTNYRRRIKILKSYKTGNLEVRTPPAVSHLKQMSIAHFKFLGTVIANHASVDPNQELPSKFSLSRAREDPIINVGGIKYEVPWSVLKRFPNSRLSRMEECNTHNNLIQVCDDYDNANNEYIFHRHPAGFGAILNAYFLGELHMLENTCPVSFEEELEYWMIDESNLSTCCQIRFHREKEAVSKEIREIRNLQRQVFEEEKVYFGHGKIARFRKCFWNLLEKPSSSGFAKLIAVASIIVTMLSALVLTMKTVPRLADIELESPDGPNMVVVRDSHVLLAIEHFCIIWFGCEFLPKLIIAPNKVQFLQGINSLDPLIIVTYVSALYQSEPYTDVRTMLYYLCGILRILRLLRIFKLSEDSKALEALGFTLTSTFKHLGALLLFLGIGVLVFSSLAYIAERDANDTQFVSIPTVFWWALVSMHIVQIGNVVTVTLLGKAVSFLCGLFGILFLVLPIPIIANNFNEFYLKKIRMDRTRRKGRQSPISATAISEDATQT